MLNKTYAMDELFQFSEVFDAKFDGFALTIDNFYENPEIIHDFIEDRSYPLWKYNTEALTRNGIDYNDCRITDKVAHPTRKYFNEMDRVLNMCRQHWHKGKYEWDMIKEFNCFQTITQYDPAFQHYPHTDSALDCPDNESVLNMIVYMDKHESGGTAIYDGTWLTNEENLNVLYPVGDRFDVERIIPAKFNRCVIFPGNRIHGAHINDYNKYSGTGWRYTEVQFLRPVRNTNHGR